MVDSSYFKNNKSSGGRSSGKLMDRLKKHKWIPLVILILIAFAMIAIQYVMLTYFSIQDSLLSSRVLNL